MRGSFPEDNRSSGFRSHCSQTCPSGSVAHQLGAVTLNDDAALIDYAKPIVNELRTHMVRVDSDFSATLFKAKIATAELL